MLFFDTVGEMMTHLEKLIGKEFPNLPWRDAKDMRNFIVHDYGNISVKAIYYTINNDLPVLKEELLKIKEQHI